jgi:putative addiction module component (TIGR02574 family)
MSERSKALMAQLLELPRDERLAVADSLYDSVDPSELPENDAAFDAELDRRAESIRDGTATSRPVDVVMQELRTRFQ